ncbi:hypothetical protein AAFF_G00188550 [Aldrovandia affinis]|uniref:Uncharacterized protein n=1 Tax=Aldrovandia affinis TaxID=143900 RepID=A0AAD7SYX1_9TELE|nr:hypothetical protein AAFF_G00188550 [Aldrovandia affinis]
MSRRRAGATPLPCARVRRSRCSVSKVRSSPCRKLRPNEYATLNRLRVSALRSTSYSRDIGAKLKGE